MVYLDTLEALESKYLMACYSLRTELESGVSRLARKHEITEMLEEYSIISVALGLLIQQTKEMS